MPRLKKPISLSETCLKFISGNVKSVICYHFKLGDVKSLQEYFISSQGVAFLQVSVTKRFQQINPFETIPTFLLNEIAQRVRSHPSSPGQFTPFLLTSRKRDLTVDRATPWLYLQLIDDIASLRFRSLSIAESIVPASSFLKKFTKLSYINANLDDAGLEAISRFCPFLRVVATTNWEVSDNGIRSMCHLKYLTLLKFPPIDEGFRRILKVTHRGIQHLLDNVGTLTSIEPWDLVNTLADIYQRSVLVMPQRLLRIYTSITTLHYEYPTPERAVNMIPGHVFRCAVMLCPRVTCVSLCGIPDLNDHDLLVLLNVVRLESFTLVVHTRFELSLSFLGGIVPLMEMHGEHLLEIILHSVRDVDVGYLTFKCPQLHYLHLQQCSYREHLSLSTNLRPFTESCLKQVIVQNYTEDADLPRKYWQYLLSSTELQHITLEGFSMLDDSLLQKILEKNSFPNLESLYLVDMCNVTVLSLLKFLKMDNPLNMIHFRKRGLNEELNKEIKEEIRKLCQRYDVFLNMFLDF